MRGYRLTVNLNAMHVLTFQNLYERTCFKNKASFLQVLRKTNSRKLLETEKQHTYFSKSSCTLSRYIMNRISHTTNKSILALSTCLRNLSPRPLF